LNAKRLQLLAVGSWLGIRNRGRKLRHRSGAACSDEETDFIILIGRIRASGQAASQDAGQMDGLKLSDGLFKSVRSARKGQPTYNLSLGEALAAKGSRFAGLPVMRACQEL
jgi:hypothetical protein